jgi:hypothetical protein
VGLRVRKEIKERKVIEVLTALTVVTVLMVVMGWMDSQAKKVIQDWEESKGFLGDEENLDWKVRLARFLTTNGEDQP